MRASLVVLLLALICCLVFCAATTPQEGEKPAVKRPSWKKFAAKLKQLKEGDSKKSFKKLAQFVGKKFGRQLKDKKSTKPTKKVTKKVVTKKATKKTEETATQVQSDAMIAGGATLRATTSLNVRAGTCTNHRVVATLSPGATVKATGYSGTACGYTWYGVSGSFGYGYVASNFVSVGGSPAPSPSPAPAPVSGGSNCGQAYVSGRAVGEKQCVTIDGSKVVTSTAAVFNQMKAAAAANGVHLRINSGFRTQAEQQYYYDCYRTKRCNNGNLAAAPGYSNHQNGIALDINSPSDVYNWLSRNASRFGFIRTVPSEVWHWEYRPGQRCNAIVGYSCN